VKRSGLNITDTYLVKPDCVSANLMLYKIHVEPPLNMTLRQKNPRSLKKHIEFEIG
jgi:hypothetical protein